jgi:2-oxo-4-hydroxy-4-carboxy--5-ureidoimidazoline (OHCU) decarboxylase
MNFATACQIAYPLSSAINRHLDEEDRAERRAEAVRAKAAEIISDDRWLNTLESAYPKLLDISTVNLRNAILRGTKEDFEAARIDLLAAYKTSAYRLAVKELQKESDDAAEAAALDAYEQRQGCES